MSIDSFKSALVNGGPTLSGSKVLSYLKQKEVFYSRSVCGLVNKGEFKSALKDEGKRQLVKSLITELELALNYKAKKG